MKALLLLMKTDGSGPYLLEYRGKKFLPVFDNSRQVEAFMAGRGINPDEYRIGQNTSYGFVEKAAREAKEKGVEYSTSPSSNPDDPIIRFPIDSLFSL